MSDDRLKVKNRYNEKESPIRMYQDVCELCGMKSPTLQQRIPISVSAEATVYVGLSLNEGLLCWYLCTICADKIRQAVTGVIDEVLDTAIGRRDEE